MKYLDDIVENDNDLHRIVTEIYADNLCQGLKL